MKYSVLFFLLAVFTIQNELNAQDLSAKQIIENANNLTLGKSAKGEMEMTIERPSWSRTVTMKTWGLGPIIRIFL